jgi:AAA15 family ATPase/GTPase
MNEHFLTDIEIKQFKCFTDFKAAGFKRVNLIGGKNNIGKTALMEACIINVYSRNINTMVSALYGIKQSREILNIIRKDIAQPTFLDSTKKYEAESNIKKTIFQVIEEDATKQYQFIIGDSINTKVNAKDLYINPELVQNIHVIDTFGWPNLQLLMVFQAIQKQDKESELNSYINEFDNNIKAFKAIGDKPQCKVAAGEYRDIVEFGDGLKHYISIICAIYASQDGYFFIDEVDNGIYYEHFDRLWEIILTLSKETNCQVFATTHSKEMLESFARVSKKLDEQDVSYTLLVKNKKQELKTISLDYEALVDSVITHEHEVR